MMRVEDSREAGLLNSSTQYSSLETTRRMSGLDIPVSRRSNGKRQCYTVSTCIVLVAVVAIASACVVTWKKYAQDDSNNGHIRNEPQSIAEAPGPQEYTTSGAGHGWAGSGPAPAVQATEPVASPLPSPFYVISPAPMPTSSYSPSFDVNPYEIICNKTIDRAVCLNMFRSYHKRHKVINLQQSTVIAMEAAEHALNKSYILAQNMKKRTEGNAALQQCIDVFADALENVNTSMSLVAAMDVHSPSSTEEDVQTFMSAAMTNQDTCQEGIDEVGPFPGSDQITGKQAKHVNTMLSIALAFVNHLSTPTMDPGHHRRLLHTESAGSERMLILGRRGLLSLQH